MIRFVKVANQTSLVIFQEMIFDFANNQFLHPFVNLALALFVQSFLALKFSQSNIRFYLIFYSLDGCLLSPAVLSQFPILNYYFSFILSHSFNDQLNRQYKKIQKRILFKPLTYINQLMMMKNQSPENPSPEIHRVFVLTPSQQIKRRQQELRTDIDDEFDQLEIFDLVRHINDPQHPLTLEQLNVVSLQHCTIKTKSLNIESKQYITIVQVIFTPTIPHCSMAQMIGLMIKVKLIKFLPKTMKIKVKVAQGSHVNEKDINKQLNDKERVSAALQNSNIGRILERGFHGSDRFNFENIF